MSTGALLFVNAMQVMTCAGAPRARRGNEMSDAVVTTGTAVLVEGETIAATGTEDSLRAEHPDATIIDCERGVLTPGFVDSHTHAAPAPRSARVRRSRGCASRRSPG